MQSKLFRNISFITLAAVIVEMMAATVVEKVCGTEKAFSLFYHSPVFIALWAIVVVSGLVWLWKAGVPKRPAVLMLHLSFVVILFGALLTHLTSSSGTIFLHEGEYAVSFENQDKEEQSMPMKLRLDRFTVERYPGSEMASDYRSTVTLTDGDWTETADISMNRILKRKGYRFYQSQYGTDEGGLVSVISVSHDPWGTPVTYFGYLTLLLSLIWFFFCKSSSFRLALGRLKGVAVAAVLFVTAGSAASAAPKALPEDLADTFGHLYVYYNGRVAPMQTMARDYVMKAYGKPSVQGYTAEQVFTGWLFYYDSWKDVPLKVKKSERGTAKEMEKMQAVASVASWKALKMFPYAGTWYSPADHIPAEVALDMPEGQLVFTQKCLGYVNELVFMKDYDGAREVLEKVREYQEKLAGDVIPSPSKVRAERLYNAIGRPMALAMLCLTLGMLMFILTGIMLAKGKTLDRKWTYVLVAFAAAMFLFLTLVLALRWYVSGHVPMASGFEMMMTIAWASMLLTALLSWKLPVLQPLGLLLSGFALLVAVLGESNPQITPLMPVLSSPLLSIHVSCMMISYTIFGLAALTGLMGVVVPRAEARQKMADLALVIIYPGLFLLVAGTFLGAVWANVSWGSYWAWDPKETWALVTILVYAFAVHGRSLKIFREPKFFCWFCMFAFLSVLITYFGVNLILGGMHSYA